MPHNHACATASFTPEAHSFDPEILREYDIRGQVGDTLCEQDAYSLGLAFGTYIVRQGGSRICVGFDGRHSSPALSSALIEGLVATGIAVENVGLGPSPMLYFAVKDLMTDAGIMVTGSHNPSSYNGFKMMLQGGPVFGGMIQDIGKIAAAGDFETGTGSVRALDVREDYVNRLLRDCNATADNVRKIAWDCGNGAGGEIVRMLTARLPGDHILLFDEIDGAFPNHHPDPTVDDNLAALIETVRREKCDFGVAFDGDADRIGVVDENGTIIRCDMLLALYAREILEDRPGAPIIADVKCSQALFDEIERMHGMAVMWKTGHSLIKNKMAELKAPLAGELSGHIFFADKWYGFDDGIYCAIRLLNEICESDDPLSAMTAHFPDIYNTPEIRIEVDEREKFDIVEKITESIKSLESDEYKVDDIDGIRVTGRSGWWLVRASNTQNALVMRAEADTPENLDLMKNMLRNEIRKHGYDITFPE